MSRFHHLQGQMRTRLHGGQCVYCGQVATCEDHFPPACALKRGLLLPACHECNALAGTEWAFNFSARAAFVKGKIEDRYGAELRIPNWTKQELKQTKGGLRKYIKDGCTVRDETLARLKWDPLAYIATIDVDGVFEQTVTEVRAVIERGIPADLSIPEFLKRTPAEPPAAAKAAA